MRLSGCLAACLGSLNHHALRAPALSSQPDQLLNYEVMATLGYGAKSTIFAVKDKDNHVYALKRVIKESPKDHRFLEQAIHEYEVCTHFQHEALRKSFKLIKVRKLLRLSEVYVLMELVDGLTLEQHQPETLEELCRLIQRVAQGLQAMHDAGYVHADIKPKNIMVTDKQTVKLIDFGQSCPVGTVKQRIQGTPDYIAPEQVLRRQITPQTDVFNLGASLYWLLTRQYVPTLIPKNGSDGFSGGAEKAKPPAQINPDVPTGLSNLVMHCVHTEPSRRPATMIDLIERLDLAIAQLRRAGNTARPPGSANGDSSAPASTSV